MPSSARFICLCCLLLSYLNAQSVATDSQEICSAEVYSTLTTMLAGEDTTITPEQWHCIYYGSTQLPTYSPYVEDQTAKIVRELRLRKRDNYETLINTNQLLRHNPAFLEMYYHQAKSAMRLGEEGLARRAMRNYLALLNVPLSSGDGLTPQTAFLIRAPADADLILNTLGFEKEFRRSTEWADKNQPFLVITAINRQGETMRYYFDLFYPYIVGADQLVANSGRRRSLK
ncbi:MAG: DUF4919 domain-containing protein [Bacteroidota bacterium]